MLQKQKHASKILLKKVCQQIIFLKVILDVLNAFLKNPKKKQLDIGAGNSDEIITVNSIILNLT